MDVQRRNHEASIALDDAIDIDQCDNKTRATAVRVLEDSQQVFVNADSRRLQCMEYGKRRPMRHLRTSQRARAQRSSHFGSLGRSLVD